MTNEIRAIAMALAALVLASCSGACSGSDAGDAGNGQGEPAVMGEEWDLARGADVYVVGTCGRLFKNGVTTSLGDDRIRAGNSVFVSGGDVYIACEAHPPALDSDAGPYPLLWKNGEARELEGAGPGQGISEIHQVLVSGGDVYVAGSRGGKAALWVNGGLRLLDSGWYNLTDAYSVFVSGGDVYVGGTADWISGIIWKNGVRQAVNPPGGRYARVRSVFVSGGDVHAAVTDWVGESRAHVFRKGEAHLLDTDASASKIVVSGGDVYVAGNENKGAVPVLWKNGVKQRLTDGSGFARANGLSVSGGNVYVAGSRRELHETYTKLRQIDATW